MNKLLKTIVVTAAVTLAGTAAEAAQSASQIAASWCPDPSRVGRDGLTCARATAIRAREMVWYEAYENWLLFQSKLSDTDSEFKKWNRNKILLALDCAYSVKNSGARFRSPAQFQAAALATYNRVMARPYSSRWTQNSGDCGW